MTTLIIARHGNTFEPDETPRRVGARTDLPLVTTGQEQARALGRHLKTHNLLPDIVYTSTLKRTQETARLALAEAGIKRETYHLKIFDEIDYGPDENQTEETVIKRIGKDTLKNWEENSIIPSGWNTNTEEILQNWTRFMNTIHDLNEKVLVLTSNGIARFAPQIAENYPDFHKKTTLKLATGAIGILEFQGVSWHLKNWNIRPAL